MVRWRVCLQPKKMMQYLPEELTTVSAQVLGIATFSLFTLFIFLMPRVEGGSIWVSHLTTGKGEIKLLGVDGTGGWQSSASFYTSGLQGAADVNSGFTNLLYTSYFLVYSCKKVEDQVLNLPPSLEEGERCTDLPGLCWHNQPLTHNLGADLAESISHPWLLC